MPAFGEVLDATPQAWRMGVPPDENAWRVEKALMTHLESMWSEPDEGIWRCEALDGPVDRWRAVRDTIHREVCENGYNPAVGAFVQFYGSRLLDAQSADDAAGRLSPGPGALPLLARALTEDAGCP